MENEGRPVEAWATPRLFPESPPPVRGLMGEEGMLEVANEPMRETAQRVHVAAKKKSPPHRPHVDSAAGTSARTMFIVVFLDKWGVWGAS